MTMRWCLGLVAMAVGAAAQADGVDLNLNNDSVYAAYIGSYRSAETAYAAFGNGQRESRAVSATLLAYGEQRNASLRADIGIGGRAYLASIAEPGPGNSKEVSALGLGGQVRVFPLNGPLGIGVSGFFSPEVVTGLDARSFWETGARLEFEVIRNSASVYVGYRQMRMNLEAGGYRILDRDTHAGVRIMF